METASTADLESMHGLLLNLARHANQIPTRLEESLSAHPAERVDTAHLQVPLASFALLEGTSIGRTAVYFAAKERIPRRAALACPATLTSLRPTKAQGTVRLAHNTKVRVEMTEELA